jgi:small redox-active disulfide protein 2
MKVQILGMGCAKCRTLEQNARDAIAAAGLSAEVEKLSDPVKIAEMGVMSTPALAIDGEVKSVGKLLTKDQIVSLLKGEN